MGLASKLQQAGKASAGFGGPPMGGAQPGYGQPPPQQQQAYGQQQQQQRPQQPPYPSAGGPPGGSNGGAPYPPQPNSNTRPPQQGFTANQPSTNPYAQQQQTQPGGFGQQGRPQQPPPQQQGYGQQPGGYGQQQGAYGQQPPQQGSYGQQPPQQGYGQQPQYGAAGAPRPAGGAGGSAIRDNLYRIARENQLEIFYPPQRLDQVVQRVERIDLNALAANWDIPYEIAIDLCSLALYDVVFYCDDSGSMRAEERGERIDDLKTILSKAAGVASLFDDDGIEVRFMNNSVEGNGIRSAEQAVRLVDNVRFSGITPLGTQLDRKVIKPIVVDLARRNQLAKPILVIVVSDGAPVGENRSTVRDVVLAAVNETTRAGYPGAVRFQFAQVGTDLKAQEFLAELDNDRQIGKYIDATSHYELEAEEFSRENGGMDLSPSLWLVKMMVGAIDRTYDEQDEGR